MSSARSTSSTPVPASTATTESTETPLPASTLTPSPVPDTSTPTPQIIVLCIPADVGWVDTGIEVASSQSIMTTSKGDVNTWGGSDISNSNADGQPDYICEQIDCAMINMNFGTLVGRIGTSFTLASASGGRLFPVVNDWEYFDNLRAFDVTITVP